jgi:hypothetical protein
MATIEKQFVVAAPAARVWSAFRDLGAVHTRLVSIDIWVRRKRASDHSLGTIGTPVISRRAIGG